ncbi:MAG: FkbM family methyltransferase [Candidatus Peregrinibacteria bacterium]
MQKEIRLFGRPLAITIRNDGDWAIAHELFLDHQYRFCDEVIRKATNPIIDIGGHLGFFALYAALLNPNVPIYSFEPHEGNFTLLKENLKQNHILNAHPRQLAVSNAVGQAELYLSQEDLNHSTTCAIEPTGATQKVQTTTLERIMEKNGIGRCDLVKMDCEGAEFEILYNTPKTIFDRIPHIFLEYHDWVEGQSSEKLKQFLKNQGYRVEKYPNHKMKELGFLWCSKP